MGNDSLGVFREWLELMINNRECMKKGEALEGFILPFEDHRSSKKKLG